MPHTQPDPSDPNDQHDPLHALGYHAGPWPALLAEIDPDPDAHGRVIRADRGAATALTPLGPVRFTWTPAQPPPVTGDWVAVDHDPDDHDRARLIGIAPRRTAITRPGHHIGYRASGADPDDPKAGKPGHAHADQVLAANPDLVGITTPVDGEVNLRRLERGIVLAYEAGATPVAILTKADVPDADDLRRAMAEATRTAPGIDVIPTSTHSGEGIDALRAMLAPDRTMALLGASGAGKSTLTNALVGQEVLATGDIRAVDRKGRHTTTHRELVVLPSGGAVLDTPGLRTLSLGQVGEGIDLAFPEIEALAGGCRFGDCRHDGEPGCAVLAALDDGTLHHDRFEGWQRIRAESENAALRADKAAYRKAARQWGQMSREVMALKPGRGRR